MQTMRTWCMHIWWEDGRGWVSDIDAFTGYHEEYLRVENYIKECPLCKKPRPS